MADNVFNKQFNPVNWLKNQLKSYLTQYHDYPTEKYVGEFLKLLTKDIVHVLEQIFLYGLTAYFSLFGLLMVFQDLHSIIKLGTSFLESFTVIFLLGLIVIAIKSSIKGICNIKEGRT